MQHEDQDIDRQKEFSTFEYSYPIAFVRITIALNTFVLRNIFGNLFSSTNISMGYSIHVGFYDLILGRPERHPQPFLHLVGSTMKLKIDRCWLSKGRYEAYPIPG